MNISSAQAFGNKFAFIDDADRLSIGSLENGICNTSYDIKNFNGYEIKSPWLHIVDNGIIIWPYERHGILFFNFELNQFSWQIKEYRPPLGIHEYFSIDGYQIYAKADRKSGILINCNDGSYEKCRVQGSNVFSCPWSNIELAFCDNYVMAHDGDQVKKLEISNFDAIVDVSISLDSKFVIISQHKSGVRLYRLSDKKLMGYRSFGDNRIVSVWPRDDGFSIIESHNNGGCSIHYLDHDFRLKLLVFNKYLGISPMYAFNGSRIFDDGNIWDGDGVTNIRSQYGFNYNEKSAQQGDAPEPASPAR
jgi:hypothetical protein